MERIHYADYFSYAMMLLYFAALYIVAASIRRHTRCLPPRHAAAISYALLMVCFRYADMLRRFRCRRFATRQAGIMLFAIRYAVMMSPSYAAIDATIRPHCRAFAATAVDSYLMLLMLSRYAADADCLRCRRLLRH